MAGTKKIKGTAVAWESGDLGRDAGHAAVAPKDIDKAVDDALGMQMISIRLAKELIQDFKTIAKIRKVGYQPLMRDALKRFAEAEYKLIAIESANEVERLKKEQAAAEQRQAEAEKASTEKQGKTGLRDNRMAA